MNSYVLVALMIGIWILIFIGELVFLFIVVSDIKRTVSDTEFMLSQLASLLRDLKEEGKERMTEQ